MTKFVGTRTSFLQSIMSNPENPENMKNNKPRKLLPFTIKTVFILHLEIKQLKTEGDSA